jgi:hypothetical protein
MISFYLLGPKVVFSFSGERVKFQKKMIPLSFHFPLKSRVRFHLKVLLILFILLIIKSSYLLLHQLILFLKNGFHSIESFFIILLNHKSIQMLAPVKIRLLSSGSIAIPISGYFNKQG